MSLRMMVVVVLAAMLVCGGMLGGCKKESPAPVAPAGPNSVASAAGEQTICPVVGGPIDKSIFVEYKGKKVYFCCASCKELFEKDPESFVAKLPQFAK